MAASLPGGPDLPDGSTFQGPLHLCPHLTGCPEPLEKVLREAFEHSISSITSIACQCRPSTALRMLAEDERSADPERRRSASSRREALQKHWERRISASSASRLRSAPAANAGDRAHDSQPACRVFSVEMNEEGGILRAFCRRCAKMFVICDRALYWGVPQTSKGATEAFPYRCTCGGHAFELGLGFDYPEDPIDENDIQTVTVAARCAACEQVSMILHEET